MRMNRIFEEDLNGILATLAYFISRKDSESSGVIFLFGRTFNLQLESLC
jgi:hypothetical protein